MDLQITIAMLCYIMHRKKFDITLNILSEWYTEIKYSVYVGVHHITL